MQPGHKHTAPLTHRLSRLASAPADHRKLPPEVVLRAKHSIADWFACAIAGAAHEDAEIQRAFALQRAAEGPCTVIGETRRVGATTAALANGFSGHVLDWDDVNLECNVHATAAVLPALWALAEERGATGAALIDAFIAGIDATCLLGRVAGTKHYDTGWHASSVLGIIGAAAACTALAGLNQRRANTSLQLAFAQASGAQAVFGTAAKPLQIARAAEGGLQAALLAEAGLSGRMDGLDGARGLAHLYSFEFGLYEVESKDALSGTLIKVHASCFGTQAPLDALAELQSQGLNSDSLGSLEVRLAPHTARVCSIKQPSSGTEIKFSTAHLCAMRLAGLDTGTPDAFTDAIAKDAPLRALARRIAVIPSEGLGTGETELRARLADGTELSCRLDRGIPESDLEAQGRRVQRKYLALASPSLGEAKSRALFEALMRIEQVPNVRDVLSAQ